MPRVLEPTTVVSIPDKVEIKEFAGGASDGQAATSIAHVKAKGGFAEEWQTPDFDEWVLILNGSVKIEYAHGEPCVVKAGQGVYLAKGERVRWVFAEDCEYVPICLPAFSPMNVYREEGPEAKPPPHDAHTDVYHLVQVPVWEKAKAEGAMYYPPTYEADGFTHATADPKFLLGVGNHFYKSTTEQWRCLKMTRATIAAAGLTLKWEWPAPVGETKPLDDEQSGGERFPHLFSGIPTTGGVVLSEHEVTRGEDGSFLGIEGVC
mmetsp:Transcript_13472/g.44396  ORF Transcript_13472/g.44396 Transcript_13472/m.44396 type:complete len:263 (-) Transcript_13472:2165-2953(-)